MALDLPESAGYIAAFVGALAHGSYGVPVKATKDVDVHPLILQSYKTLVLAFMSCVVIPLWCTYQDSSHQIQFTPFGILSGFLWVSGGACGIYGIRQAGMAIAVGTWASLMVCVNFTFGILIFREPVHSFVESCMAFGLLLVGLVGMSKYSAKTTTTAAAKTTSDKDGMEDTNDSTHHNNSNSSLIEDGPSSNWEVEMRSTPSSPEKRSTSSGTIGTSTRRLPKRGTTTTQYNNNGSSGSVPVVPEPTDIIAEDQHHQEDLTTSLLKKVTAVVYGDNGDEEYVDHDDDRHKKFSYSNLNVLAIYRLVALVPSMIASLTARQRGIVMAAMNGILGGCALVPLHYAKKQGFQGLTYIPSFGLGSFVANIGLWTMYFGWTYYQQLQQSQQQLPIPDQETTTPSKKSSPSSIWKLSMDLMPSFYWSKLWKRGLFAGFLLSIGMICSILATGCLGQGVGNSLVQLKILISGLWGIFYYKEIQNKRSIQLWFLSASICVSGILGLSYQRLMATNAATRQAVVHTIATTTFPQVGVITSSSINPISSGGTTEAPLLPVQTAATTTSNAVLDTPAIDLPNTQG